MAFQKWMILDCPTWAELRAKLPPDEYGRIPHKDHIARWAMLNNWPQRKDEIRGDASLVMQNELVNQTVQMWREHAEAAATVRRKALKYIEDHDFDSSASAIQAIKWAQEEERKTRGVEAFITSIKSSSDGELLEMIRGLADRHSSTTEGEVVDAEDFPKEE